MIHIFASLLVAIAMTSITTYTFLCQPPVDVDRRHLYRLVIFSSILSFIPFFMMAPVCTILYLVYVLRNIVGVCLS